MNCKKIMSSKIFRSIVAYMIVLIILFVPGCTTKNDKGTDGENTSARCEAINEFSRSLESVRYNDIDIVCGFPEEKMKAPVLYSLDSQGNTKIIYRPQKKLRIEELELSGEWIYFFEMESNSKNKVYIPGSDSYRCKRNAKRFLSKIKVDGTEYQQIKVFSKDTSVWNLRVDVSGNIYYLMSREELNVASWLSCYNQIDGSEKSIGFNYDKFDLRDGKVYAINEIDSVQYMFSSDRRQYEKNDTSGKWYLDIYKRTEDGTFLEEKVLDIQNYYGWMTPTEHEGSVYYLREENQENISEGTDEGREKNKEEEKTKKKKAKKKEDDTKLTLCRRCIDGDWSEETLYSFDKLVDARNMQIFDGYIYYYECEEEFLTFPGVSSGFFYDRQTALCRRKIEPGAEKEIIYLPGMELSANKELSAEKKSSVEKEDSANKKSSANEKKDTVRPGSYGKMCFFGDCIVIEKSLGLFNFDVLKSYDPEYEYISFVKVDLTSKRAIEIGRGKRTKTSTGFKEYYYWTGVGRNLILTFPTGKYVVMAEDKILNVDDLRLHGFGG